MNDEIDGGQRPSCMTGRWRGTVQVMFLGRRQFLTEFYLCFFLDPVKFWNYCKPSKLPIQHSGKYLCVITCNLGFSDK